MKLVLKQPITVDGKTYEYGFMSLSTSSGFSNPNEYTFALRIIPYRINENNEIEKLEEASISHSYLNVLNSPISETGEAIIDSIQELLNK
jgi:hypothetical protein